VKEARAYNYEEKGWRFPFKGSHRPLILPQQYANKKIKKADQIQCFLWHDGSCGIKLNGA
jgi:hypothetical protein